MNCPKCNYDLPDDARFCLGCGAPVQLNCSSCSTPLPAGAKFCLSCGQPVGGQQEGKTGSRDDILGYCGGCGLAIRGSDPHFKCVSCNRLYTAQFRFLDRPVCGNCAYKGGTAQQLEKELSAEREAAAKAKELAAQKEKARLAQARQREEELAARLRQEAARKARLDALVLLVEKYLARDQLDLAEEELENLGTHLAEDGDPGADGDFQRLQAALEKARSETRPHICPVTGMEFVNIPAGEFQMGDVWGDGEDVEKPTRLVCLPAFQLAKYPVTQSQWLEVMGGENPAASCEERSVHPDKPVINVDWDDAHEFISRLNRESGCSYRLPSEAEREYAARSGGSRDKYSGTSSESSLSAYGWYNKNSDDRTHSVGRKRPNDLGLYDMSGNVFEWCEDVWHTDYKGAPCDGSAWTSGGDSSQRVYRGGSWLSFSRGCRVAFRGGLHRGNGNSCLGFRLSQDSLAGG